MSFYRLSDGSLETANNNLFGPGFCLLISEYQSYEYPVEGWYWFDTDEEALAFFNIELDATESSPETPII